MARIGSTGSAKKAQPKPIIGDRRNAYKTKTPPYDRSPREFVKRESTPKKTRAAGKAFVQKGDTSKVKSVVKQATTPAEAKGTGKMLKNRTAKATIRRVTRAAVRKGISGPTEDSLGITRQEGGRAVRKAVKRLGTEKATKVATKTRLRKGQTYKGGKGWVGGTKKTTRRRSTDRKAL